LTVLVNASSLQSKRAYTCQKIIIIQGKTKVHVLKIGLARNQYKQVTSQPASSSVTAFSVKPNQQANKLIIIISKQTYHSSDAYSPPEHILYKSYTRKHANSSLAHSSLDRKGRTNKHIGANSNPSKFPQPSLEKCTGAGCLLLGHSTYENNISRFVEYLQVCTPKTIP